MKNYHYSERNVSRHLIFALLYLSAWICGAIWYAGGFLKLANLVDNFPSAKMLGLLAGVVIILPFFLLLRIISTKVTLAINNNTLTVRKKGQADTVIPFTSIYRMDINVQKINTLHIYDKNGKLLWAVVPQTAAANLLEEVPAMILKTINFQKSSVSQRYFTARYVATTYQR